MDYCRIGRRIKTIRKRRGFTQQELAEFAGLSVPYVSHIERGYKKASLESLVYIAKALEVTVDQFLIGNQNADYEAYFLEVQELLRDCTDEERQTLLAVVEAVKRSLRST